MVGLAARRTRWAAASSLLRSGRLASRTRTAASEAFQRARTAFHAERFHRVVGLAQAGGVVEHDGYAVQIEGLFQHVAGSAGDFGDDGAIGAEQRVHEGRLADVGAAHQGHAQAVALHDSAPRRVARASSRRSWSESSVEASRARSMAGTSSSSKSTSASIWARRSRQAARISRTASERRPASWLAATARAAGSGRGHQVRDGLGLGQVQAAVEEGAEGEFARAGGAGAGGQQAVQYAAQGNRAAVAAQLGNVLAGVRAWTRHEEQQGLVDQLIVAVEDLHQVRIARFGVAGAAGDAAGNPQGFRPAHANHADATAPYRGRDGGDGVGCGGAGVHQRCAEALAPCMGGFYGRRRMRLAGR